MRCKVPPLDNMLFKKRKKKVNSWERAARTKGREECLYVCKTLKRKFRAADYTAVAGHAFIAAPTNSFSSG